VADISDLLELTRDLHPPALADLERVARRRRRRAVTGVVAAMATTAVVIVLVGQPLGMRGATPAPVAPEPSPTTPTPTTPDRTRSPSEAPAPTARADGTFRALTPDELRDHPDAVSQLANPSTGAPGVAARTWSVCLGDCSYDKRPPKDGELQRMLEVTSDGFRTSAMHPLVTWDSNISHAVDDWYLVDASQRAPRLVSSRGDDVALTRGSTTDASEIAGPLVYSTQGVAWVDMEGRVLHTMTGSGPGGGWDWWGAEDSWFWGSVYRVGESSDVVEQGLTWRNPDGSFGVHMLPFPVTEWSTQTLRSDRPGTMGAIEPGPTRLLHVSTDYGSTWQVRRLPRSWGAGTDVPRDWETWVDDWPSWPAA
jgi:hypothetical protein